MRYIKILSTTVFLFSLVESTAQTPDTAKSKKPWYLTFAFDLKTRSVSGHYYYHYTGEFANENEFLGGKNWQWIDFKNENRKYLEGAKFISPKLDVMISRSRNYKVGMSYDFGSISRPYYFTDSTGRVVGSARDYTLFLAISAIGEYDYYFKKTPASPFVYASGAIGYYRGSAAIEGEGRERFYQWRLGAGYAGKTGWMGRVYFSNDYLTYREKGTSPVFNRPQSVSINTFLHYIGIGVVKQFTLIPD